MLRRLCLLWVEAVIVVGACLAGTGCARHYTMVLNNGNQLSTASKPKLQGAFYVYKGANGELQYVPQARVREITSGNATSAQTKFRPAAKK